jgi:hypothetical protein
MAANNTIESIKRQMQNMKSQKEDAFDRAEKAEQKTSVLLEKQSKVEKIISNNFKPY